MKVAIVTDSNSGMTQQQGREEGIRILPMPFMIDGTTFFEEIDLSQEQFYEKMAQEADITTSQPAPGSVTDLWEELLKDYDQIVHIPMSSSLSGSFQTARLLAEDYEGRVQVVNNRRVSVTQRQSALDARDLAGRGYDALQIREILEKNGPRSMIYITVDTLKYLKKGGRVTPAAAALGSLLKIKPVLQIDGEKLDAFSKARTMKQARTVMLSALEHDLENRLGDKTAAHSTLQVAHTCSQEAALELQEQLRELYPHTPVYLDHLALSIACHIGPGSLAVTCCRIPEELE